MLGFCFVAGHGAFYLSNGEAEAGGYLNLMPFVYKEFQASQGKHTENLSSKNKTNKNMVAGHTCVCVYLSELSGGRGGGGGTKPGFAQSRQVLGTELHPEPKAT